MTDRLFVPLSTEPFIDFRDRGKQYEIRAYGRNFTDRSVYTGRMVELRKGWSKGESLWGEIGEVIVGSLEDIFSLVDFKSVEPQKKSRKDAISENRKLLGNKQQYIAFKVLFNFVEW